MVTTPPPLALGAAPEGGIFFFLRYSIGLEGTYCGPIDVALTGFLIPGHVGGGEAL